MHIKKEVNDLIKRGLDSHLRLAVTGLSRAGKTAFITSLVNQLLHSASHDNLPLFDASRHQRLLGAKRVPQKNVMVPRFDYQAAMESLYAIPPQWPEPTRDVSEIRLAIRFKPTKGVKRMFKNTTTLYLDIVDYPGEWLLDLPLLEMTFEDWSLAQMNLLKKETTAPSLRKSLAQDWLAQLPQLDLAAEADEQAILHISQAYTDYLHACKKSGLYWVQPGRFVLPGELAGAPVLQFFPVDIENMSQKSLSKESNYTMLKKRFEQYKKKIVQAFYKEYFSTFDRQVVLVDCLQPLNLSHEAFMDMSGALNQLMQSFKYGHNHFLSRLFSAKIDKVMFAATKADHLTPDQHVNLVSLLQQLVYDSWQQVSYEGIEIECLSLASIQATTPGYVAVDNTQMQAIKGITTENETITLYPGDVPKRLPEPSYWQKTGFEFIQFNPQPVEKDQPLPHIRLDRVLEFLLGDKLR